MAAASMTIPAAAVPVRKPTNPWLIAATVPLATFMEILDTTIVNVSLAHIAGDLSAGTDESTWVLTSYLVSNAIVLPLAGWMSALIGRKNFYLFSVALFTVASACCGLAPSLGILIFFRIIQGLGGGGLQPVAQAILVDAFPPAKRAMAQAIYGITAIAAPVIGPTLGGWLTDNFSWRWVFLINIPVGIIAFVVNSRTVQDPPTMLRRKFSEMKMDYVGLGFLTLGLGSLQVVLDKGQNEDWFGSNFIVTFAVLAVIGLVALVVWELRQETPVVDLSLFKDRSYTLAVSAMLTLGFALYGSSTLLPIFTQQQLGYTSFQSGLVLCFGGLVVVMMMPLSATLLKFVDARFMVAIGLLVNGLSLIMMSHFNAQADFWTLAQARMVQGVGLAFLFVPLNTLAFGLVPKDKVNSASGLINLARNLGGSFGIAGVITLLARRSQAHQAMLVGHLTPGDPSYLEFLDRSRHLMESHGVSAADASKLSFGMLGRVVSQQASLLSFIDAFFLLGMTSIAVMPLVLLIRKPKPLAGPVSAH